MTERDSPAWTTLAHLLRPQGRKGELLAELYTDFPERLAERAGTILAQPGFAGSPAEARRVQITHSWLPTGRNQGRIVLAFAGVKSISQAEEVAGLDLLIPTSERIKLEGGAEYIDDLVGCTVFDGQLVVGSVESVEFPSTADGARRIPEIAPLLTVVTEGGNEILIPFASSFLVEVDTPARRIHMRLPAGLLELNSPSPAEG